MRRGTFRRRSAGAPLPARQVPRPGEGHIAAVAAVLAGQRWPAAPGAVRALHPAAGWCRGSCGNAVLRHVAERSEQSFQKYSLQDLLQLQDLAPAERLDHLDRVLQIGISKIVLLLQDLPLGFGSRGSIRDVIRDYVQDIRDLRDCRPEDPEKYRLCILTIFARHRSMLGQITNGLQEFQRDITECFEPIADLGPTVCADVADIVPAVRKIESTLDEFFSIRTTLRLLIAHCLQLTPDDRRDEIGFAMHELLQGLPDSLRGAGPGGLQSTYVGAICLDTRPSLILIEAYRHAQFMCKRQYQKASQLFVNGIPATEFLEQGRMETRFPYVDIHLYFVFFEVLRTAMVTSIRKAGPDEEPPPIHASLITGTSLMTENERTVKITDFGEGINRDDVRRVWSYFNSTVMEAPEDVGATGTTLPLPGRGLGLAVSRVLVRYFGGEMDLHSIPRKGTDVYIYL